MTWAKSEPVDPEDKELPFTEEDFRRRKPHPTYKEHLSAEKTILKFGKTVSYFSCLNRLNFIDLNLKFAF